ncbi:hypothetical protein MRB53_009551 [Persea americana]|uniref:Uncharacterized protein n=1 Tax=Persea americana TaxID=3435 RepID=A0ACC2LPC3_PERAE|nr:hypothetical protein MRB53_009551 [Persea americana]|eukprot:TRINITY_DN281_c7_g1_i1.p1 TRINITY_DN281_c7_g1~~TRINITY_DN281_c7_g1_i1.p1  ORF type:complete len:263 (-),score=77.54 TRINITY_DN281_c7_g1_i1:536-1324(-)
MVAEKVKKQKVEENEDSSEHFDGELVASIEKLQEVQDELEKLNEEASDKVLEVEQRYNEIRKPIYDQRSEAIKKIPDFWLTAFLSHPVLCELLTDEDQKIFKYLKSLEVSDSKDVKSGYSITFNFQPNPYFENAKLTKSFSFDDEGNTTSTGTNIKWKEGMAIANGNAHENKGNKKKRDITKESFITWFGEEDTKDVHLIHDEVGDIIKEDLWVNPLQYFNNEGDDDDVDGDDEDDEDGEGNADMNDDDDDDDDEDDDEDDN